MELSNSFSVAKRLSCDITAPCNRKSTFHFPQRTQRQQRYWSRSTQSCKDERYAFQTERAQSWLTWKIYDMAWHTHCRMTSKRLSAGRVSARLLGCFRVNRWIQCRLEIFSIWGVFQQSLLLLPRTIFCFLFLLIMEGAEIRNTTNQSTNKANRQQRQPTKQKKKLPPPFQKKKKNQTQPTQLWRLHEGETHFTNIKHNPLNCEGYTRMKHIIQILNITESTVKITLKRNTPEKYQTQPSQPWRLYQDDKTKNGKTYPVDREDYIRWWWDFPRLRELGRMFDSPPVPLNFFFFFWSGVLARAHYFHSFMSGTVHNGSAGWDDCGRMFPGKLRVRSFLGKFPHHTWTAV